MSPTTISCGFENHSSQRREFHNPNFSVFLQFVTRHFVYPGAAPPAARGGVLADPYLVVLYTTKKCHEAHSWPGAIAIFALGG
jgi:hypothetical protein